MGTVKNEHEKLRTVKLVASDDERYILHVYDTGRVDGRGHTVLSYVLLRGRVGAGPEALFEGDDFAGSPSHADDSDETMRALLGFLTLCPGDTDRGYFEAYTPRQLEWAEAHAQALALAAEARFGEG